MHGALWWECSWPGCCVSCASLIPSFVDSYALLLGAFARIHSSHRLLNTLWKLLTPTYYLLHSVGPTAACSVEASFVQIEESQVSHHHPSLTHTPTHTLAESWLCGNPTSSISGWCHHHLGRQTHIYTSTDAKCHNNLLTSTNPPQQRFIMTHTETLFKRIKPRDQRPYIEFQGEEAVQAASQCLRVCCVCVSGCAVCTGCADLSWRSRGITVMCDEPTGISWVLLASPKESIEMHNVSPRIACAVLLCSFIFDFSVFPCRCCQRSVCTAVWCWAGWSSATTP
jgi:hypothetical protein